MTKTLLLALGLSTALGNAAMAADTSLTVMVFNVWGGGANDNKPIDETVAAIKAAGPDIVIVAEARTEGSSCTADSCPAEGESVAPKLGAALGFNHYDQMKPGPATWANAVLSRYPIVKPLDDDLGVAIDVNGKTVHVYSLHLTDFPYQPYQLLNIEYGKAPFLKTAEEAIKSADDARGKALAAVIAKADAEKADAVILGGDFNEPSHKDWTAEAVAAKLQPLAVMWPATTQLEKAGFVDLYRAVNPDPVAKPGFTWTPTSEASDPEDHHDRIDFLFARAPNLKVLSAEMVGEKAPEADIVVTPWPSDHRAVVSKIEF